MHSATSESAVSGKASRLHDYFDEIFVVNLEHERTKRIRALYSLSKAGVRPRLWKATNGYKKASANEFSVYLSRPLGQLFFTEYTDLELSREKRFIESPGAWGYIRTYQSILRFSLRHNLRQILILEDDIMLHKDFETYFSRFIEKVGNNWKILQLGASQYNWRQIDIKKSIHDSFYRPQILHTCGSFAIGINHSVMQELLFYLSFMEAPFDHIPLGKIYQKYPDRCFVAFPNIIVPDVSDSTIRAARDQRIHSVKMKWDMTKFEFPPPLPTVTFIFDEPSQIHNLSIGRQRLAQGFEVNWLYFAASGLKPIHSRRSPSLKLDPANKPIELPGNFVSWNPADFTVHLSRQGTYSNNEVLEAVDQLIQTGEAPPDFQVLSQCKAFATGLMPPHPQVTVVIPTFKRPTNLAAAIESVRAQTYDNIEILVVDDNAPGSSYQVETEELVKSLSEGRPVKYIQHEMSLNGAAARNTGLMNSSGSLIAFLDDDDTYMPNMIKSSVDELLKLPEVFGAVYGGFLGWNSTEHDPSRYVAGDLTLEILKLNYKTHYLHTCTTLYRKTALLKINGFDDSFLRHQDLELNLRFFRYFKAGVVRELVTLLRPSPTDINNQAKGIDFFKIKVKYLNKFRPIIKTFPIAEQVEIYESNLKEIEKHLGKANRTLESLLGKTNLGPLYFSMKRVSDLQQEVAELSNQKQWYENTYERLPRLWKLVGAALRKLGLAKRDSTSQ